MSVGSISCGESVWIVNRSYRPDAMYFSDRSNPDLSMKSEITTSIPRAEPSA